jgi:hypothetical protein
VSDYDLLREYAPSHKPERQRDEESASHDHLAASLAAQHRRPDALGTSGAAHLQRVAGNAATSSLVAQREEDADPVHNVVGSGGGTALDDNTRASMEQSFGTDFSSVRVHSGGDAAVAAKSVQAQAFTVGENIVLGEGKSTSDTHTLAHELTHVVQQRSGDVPGESIGNGLKVSDPGDWAERQAEATAAEVTSGGAAHAAHDHAGGVQRETEEEPLQQLSMQRETMPDEEPEEQVAGLDVQREDMGEEPDEELV